MNQRANMANSDSNGGPSAEADTDGEPVRIVDVRWDIRKVDHKKEIAAIEPDVNDTIGKDGAEHPDPFGTASILVLP